jgi:glycosyltransferase involved in cell wall biosynthesis
MPSPTPLLEALSRDSARSQPGGPAPWVLVSAGFHQQGGQSKANAALAEFLLDRGTPVSLVGHDVDDCFLKHPLCTVRRAPRPRGSDFLGMLRLQKEGHAVAAAMRAACPRARVVVNGGCCDWPDINWVHCVHHAWGYADRGAPLWFKLKNRLVKWWARRRERQALRPARLVVANSEQTRRHLLHHLGLDPTRVHAVALGADPEWKAAGPDERVAERKLLKIAGDQPVVLFAGALSHDHNKGFDTLFAAWQALASDAGWDALLLVAGEGSALPRWRARVARAGLESRIRFIGFSSRLIAVMAAADLLVSPVRYEAYGLNVQEAVCRGVPALVSGRAGVVEQYRPELSAMVLVDPDDPQELEMRLRSWRADMAGWRERFRRLGEDLRRYAWSDMAARIVELAER